MQIHNLFFDKIYFNTISDTKIFKTIFSVFKWFIFKWYFSKKNLTTYPSPRHNGAKKEARILLNNGVSPVYGLVSTTKSSIDLITTNSGNEGISVYGGNNGHNGNTCI